MKVSKIIQGDKNQFKINSGLKTLKIRAKSPGTKQKWINALKLSQAEFFSEEKKINAIKAILNNKEYF